MHDSVDKIVTRYFGCLTKEPIEYKKVIYKPKAVTVSPLLLRGFTCPSNCGGCCSSKYTLDYLPNENPKPKGIKPRLIEVNGKKYKIFTEPNEEPKDKIGCKYLNEDNGRCNTYESRAFSCDFELIRTLEFSQDHRPHMITQKLYGRGWNMMRIDGERGAKCEMTPVNKETTEEVLRKLKRLLEWTNYFEVKTWVPEIINLIEKNRLKGPVTFGKVDKTKTFSLPILKKEDKK